MAQSGAVDAAPGTDYANSLIAITTVILILSSASIAARTYARHLRGTMSWGVDDGLAWVSYLALLANIIPNYILATSHALSPTPATAVEALRIQKAFTTVSYAFPVSMVAGKLSFLFLLRRVFTLNQPWFRTSWYAIFVVLFPCWLAMCFTWSALVGAGRLDPVWQYTYGVPLASFINTATDLAVLVLPIGVTKNLQLPVKQKAGVIGIFALGLVGTIASLVRAIRSVLPEAKHWAPHYHLYSEAALGVAEAGTVLICACLPILRPILRKALDATKRGLSLSLSTKSRTRTTFISLEDRGLGDGDGDGAPIVGKGSGAKNGGWKTEERDVRGVGY
ncbi:hypothetical protein BDV95DRAFT_378898 [Massariosphaeria phaeospora]|uniref:Rhodopsin domain-containing protein n=1 Tax=Massariosphaeria phaeospora TaxID=100035 RepID=A0A7C8MB49_9PLEO|nr:hypothetical protein BDV95DRAFT_378898 [Massariosphaeria phaeospora]